MNCDVGEATKGLENELWRRWSDGKVGEWAELIVIVIAELILQPFLSVSLKYLEVNKISILMELLIQLCNRQHLGYIVILNFHILVN